MKSNLNKISAIAIMLLMSVLACVSVNAADTAEQVMKRASDKIKAAGGISASFSMTSGSQKLNGTLKSTGSKFALETTSHSTWYDGRTMWTYSASSSETTVMTPTAGEVAESNPMALVNSYASSFTAAYAKSQAKGSKTIVLTPKSKSLGFKSVHVTISDASGLPTSVVVVPSSGTRISISISGVKTGQKFGTSSFSYPKSKYPNAEIVDLR